MNNLSLQSLRNSSEVFEMHNEVDQFSAQRLKKVLKEKGKNVTRAAFDYILETENQWKSRVLYKVLTLVMQERNQIIK